MKHCSFSILCDELPFLKQKLPFLYKHFNQLIFYDLNIDTNSFSTDGSHEFIRDYPDPEKKITLIEKTNLSNVNNFHGKSFVAKQKMFAVGSRYVRNDIDVFWCTDMDEFFSPALIPKVERVMKTRANVVLVRHLVFFHSDKWVYAHKNGKLFDLPYARIVRHKKGHTYGHCSIGEQFDNHTMISNEFFYHFAYVGDKRVRTKCRLYGLDEFLSKWESFNGNMQLPENHVHGYPDMHPGQPLGIKKNTHPIPDYIDVRQMLKDLQ